MQTVLICGGTREERKDEAVRHARGVSREDLIIVDAENDSGIEEIRQLKHRLNLKPYSSPFKVGLLENAQFLTIPAQNALLKTLEEPPEKTLLILTAPTLQILLPTIVSRCQIIPLPAKTEIQLSEEEFQNLRSLVFHFLSLGVGGRLEIASQVSKTRQGALEFCDQQVFLWRRILLEKFQIFPSQNEKLGHLESGQLVNILKNLKKNREMIEANVNPKLALENFFLRLPCGKNNE